MKNRVLLFLVILAINIITIFACCNYIHYYYKSSPYFPTNAIGSIASIRHIYDLPKDIWTRCIFVEDGTVFFRGHLKTYDGGKTILYDRGIDLEEINAIPERAFLFHKGLFYATLGPAHLIRPGIFSLDAWRSTDNFQTLTKEKAYLYIPEGPTRKPEDKEWYGLYVYRSIIEFPDGTWLMTMYGNFHYDTLPPQDTDAQKETTFMMRTIVVISNDRGHTWHYLSSVAVPKTGDPIGEGFVEPAITLLEDGRLLCVMRTGHHFPLYASWSADNGRTWTPPLYTGLDRACDPCLIRLHDNRVALSWGRRYPEDWSNVTVDGDQSHFKYPGEGYVNLAISDDGGITWVNNKIAKKTGTCYSTIFEISPNVILMQVDQWVWCITLKPKIHL